MAQRTNPRVEMALATSSMKANFKHKTTHLESDIFWVFAPENRVLGDDPRIAEGRGKPAPDIYLLALETINERLRRENGKEIEPQECLVFEDSVPGVEAGRRAGMQVVWYVKATGIRITRCLRQLLTLLPFIFRCPHPGLLNEYRGREAEVLAGLTGEHKELEEKNEMIGVVDPHGQERKKGAPGEIGDGWARLFSTLEAFPFSDYGITV
jgi:pseudouridine 5'-phosphatase